MGNFGEGGFDSAADENNESVASLIPAGPYKAVMVDSEVKDAQSGGRYLNTQWQICEGEFQNRVIFQTYNLWLTPDTDGRQKAVAIAKAHMSETCRAVGVPTPKDSSELHDKPCWVKVGVQKSKDPQYDDRNVIKEWKPVSGSVEETVPPASSEKEGNPWDKP